MRTERSAKGIARRTESGRSAGRNARKQPRPQDFRQFARTLRRSAAFVRLEEAGFLWYNQERKRFGRQA